MRGTGFTSAQQSWKRIIRKDEWAKHLDRLIEESEGLRCRQ
jgi:hypothetical protein